MTSGKGKRTPGSTAGALTRSQSRVVHSHMHDQPRTRRSAMRHSSTLDVGLEVHQESMAVTSVAKAHEAEVIDLGTIGTRHADIAHLVRQLQAKAQPLVFVYDAGPWGYWLSRDLTTKGQVCWVVAPSRMPTK